VRPHRPPSPPSSLASLTLFSSRAFLPPAEKQEAYRALGKSGLAAGVKIEIFQEIPKL